MTDLYFYGTEAGLDIQKNMVIEDINDYFDSIDAVYVAENFQYIKPALSTTIKVDFTADVASWKPAVGTICRMIQNSQNYYWFITSANWLAKSTVQLTLALDTVNTFWQQITSSLSAKTHITRQHKDRINQYGYRIFDKFSEGLTAVQYKKSDAIVYDTYESNGGSHWYLVYKTEANYDPNESQPVQCYAYPTDAINCNKIVTDSIKHITKTEFNNGAVAIYFTTAGDTVSWTDHPSIAGTILRLTLIDPDLAASHIRIERLNSGGIVIETFDVPATVMQVDIQCNNFYVSANQTMDNIATIETNSQYVYRPSGIHSRYIEPFKSVNRADSKILRIIELPYAPFSTAILSDSVAPSGWMYNKEQGTYQTLNNTLEFGHVIKPQDISSYAYVAAPHSQSVTAAHDSRFESKLWTSSFFTYKFVYDSSS